MTIAVPLFASASSAWNCFPFVSLFGIVGGLNIISRGSGVGCDVGIGVGCGVGGAFE